MKINCFKKEIDVKKYFGNKYPLFSEIKGIDLAIKSQDLWGNHCFNLALLEGKIEIINEIIKIDSKGELCYQLALFCAQWPSGQIATLEKAVIEKDETGAWCCALSLLEGCVDPKGVEEGVVKNDTSGKFCERLLTLGKGLDKQKLKNAVIEKDETGQYCLRIIGLPELKGDEREIQDAINKKDIAIYGYVKNFK